MTITKEDMEQMLTMMREASNESAIKQESLHDHTCKVRWRRRLLFMSIFIGGTYAIGEFYHLEPLLKGWELLAAPIIDKTVFGIG